MAAEHVPLLEVVTKVTASKSDVCPCGGSPVRTPILRLRDSLSTRGHHLMSLVVNDSLII